jgi:hypothetical protein
MKHIRNLKALAMVLGLVAAFAAVPALASASPVLQNSSGGTVAVGTGISGTSSNLTFTGVGPAGNLECSTSKLGGKVVTNSGSLIEGEIESASFTGPENPSGTACKTSIKIGGNAVTASIAVSGLPWCLESTGTTTWSVTGAKCPVAVESPITFTATLFEKGVTNRGTCIYKTGSMIGGTFNTGTSPLKLKITGGGAFTKTGGTFTACPASGSLSGEFTLKEAAGGELKIN